MRIAQLRGLPLRLWWSVVAGLVAGLAAVLVLSPPARAEEARPNVVVLMTDDQTVQDMRVLPETRSLLGAHGVTFDNYFASYPLCAPSRTTLLTGQFAHNHRVLGNLEPTGGYSALKGVGNTLPVWLRRAGYYTAHIGKYINGYGRDTSAKEPPGWSDWYGAVDPSTYRMWGYELNENGRLHTYGNFNVEDPKLYQTDVYRNLAENVIRRRAHSRKPFYLEVTFLAPHSENGRVCGCEGPIVRPAPRYAGRFARAKLPHPPDFNEADVSDKPSWFANVFGPMGPSQIAYAINSYRSRLASLLAVDDAVKGIVGQLKASGKLSNTLIMFASDNGFFYGEHRIPFGKYFVYEPAARVPLVIRGPGVKPGSVSHELVENTDLAATIAAAAHAKPGRRLDGRSLLPFAANPKQHTQRAILIESTYQKSDGDLSQQTALPDPQVPSQVPAYQAIHTSRYVYIRHAFGEIEFYDLKRDPYELQSRAGDPAYARTRRALAKDLSALSRCRGRACVANIGRVPAPTGR